MHEPSEIGLEPWKTLSREVVLNRPPWLIVEKHEVQLPDGQVISGWPWVTAPDYVTIAAMTHDAKFLCFRQTKYMMEGTILAPVGGYLESGETPVVAAKRELLEETGYESPHWTGLGSYVVDANRGVGRGHFFLARDARKVNRANSSDLEEQHLVLLTREKIETALARGEFKVMSWVATFALALLRLDVADETSPDN